MLCIHVRHRVSPNSRKVPEQGQMHSGKQQRGLFVLDVLAEKERKEQRDLPIQKGPNLLGEGNHVHVVSVLSIAQVLCNLYMSLQLDVHCARLYFADAMCLKSIGLTKRARKNQQLK
ncbi:uncharacterized protein LOC101767827 isoform X3 [Setaria italica]|uniref:uncharacterized protein LOC101767827 isoform X3 n=1 Tax=Setaria italica TaxID=4555 RepID=UPI000BE594FC|nr:uncharacterized protein LOC101767827 isoform X3 [Setaria italica]